MTTEGRAGTATGRTASGGVVCVVPGGAKGTPGEEADRLCPGATSY
ncbi:hypothetical protein [Streptomyces sp. NPDC029674]